MVFTAPIILRPNVGKSTLFNRLVGRRLAVVDDTPGVTRDRHYADALVRKIPYTLLDTGGFDPESSDPRTAGIIQHVKLALEECDLILCVLDATALPLRTDYAAVDLLRRSEKRVIYVANKADSSSGRVQAMDH